MEHHCNAFSTSPYGSPLHLGPKHEDISPTPAMSQSLSRGSFLCREHSACPPSQGSIPDHTGTDHHDSQHWPPTTLTPTAFHTHLSSDWNKSVNRCLKKSNFSISENYCILPYMHQIYLGQKNNHHLNLIRLTSIQFDSQAINTILISNLSKGVAFTFNDQTLSTKIKIWSF